MSPENKSKKIVQGAHHSIKVSMGVNGLPLMPWATRFAPPITDDAAFFSPPASLFSDLLLKAYFSRGE
jgi:hypothetical protein